MDGEIIDDMEPPDYRTLLDRFEGIDVKEVSYNFFPSFLYVIIISLCLKCTDFVDKNEKEMISKNKKLISYPHMQNYLKIIGLIYCLYMIKGIFFFVVVAKNKKHSKIPKIIKTIFGFILDMSFFVTSILGYYSFKILSLNFIISHIYLSIFIFFLIFSGFTHFGLFLVDSIYLVIAFFYFLNYFSDNERGFLGQYGLGEDDLIMNYFQTTKLDDKKDNKFKQDSCPICLIPFEKDEELILLKCGHYFHQVCIKDWFKEKVICPLCKETNLL